MKVNDHFNFIDRNIQSLISNNNLNLNIFYYDQNRISQIFSNFAENPLPQFFKNAKTLINYSEKPIFSTDGSSVEDSKSEAPPPIEPQAVPS